MIMTNYHSFPSVCIVLILVCVCVCRYNELMFTIETCQAASMIHKFYSPNIVASGSSRVGEDALSVSVERGPLDLADNVIAQFVKVFLYHVLYCVVD